MTTRSRRIIAGISVAVVAVGGIILANPADAATTTMALSLVQYDSPGSDNRSNASLNAEFVRIRNLGPANNLRNWTIVDSTGHTYTFPAHAIGANKTVYLHTGIGIDGVNPVTLRPDSSRLYMNLATYIWNNDKDTATLRSASGRLYDTCTWKKPPGTGVTTC